MTDTEILDYLQNDYTMYRGTPRDVQVGRVVLTLGLKPGTLREHLIAAIERDKQCTVDEVTRRLVGSALIAVDPGSIEGDKTLFDLMKNARRSYP